MCLHVEAILAQSFIQLSLCRAAAARGPGLLFYFLFKAYEYEMCRKSTWSPEIHPPSEHTSCSGDCTCCANKLIYKVSACMLFWRTFLTNILWKSGGDTWRPPRESERWYILLLFSLFSKRSPFTCVRALVSHFIVQFGKLYVYTAVQMWLIISSSRHR